MLRRESGDRWGIAEALENLGIVAYSQGDDEAARMLYEESLAMRRELGDKSGIALSLLNLGRMADRQADYDAARALYEEGLTIQRELGNRWGIACSLMGFAGSASGRQQPMRAVRLWGAAEALRQAIRTRRDGRCRLCSNLGGRASNDSRTGGSVCYGGRINRHIRIEVDTQNGNALSLYRSCGFEKISKYRYYRMEA
jgi:tetratricopeptide (TPR) repeat protein